jgi:tetratricopeptide (TPR) repeat protein
VVKERPGLVTAVEEAQSLLDAADFRRSHEIALAALQSRPGDVQLLRIAGRAGVELADPEAVNHLRAVVELEPEDAQGWRDLGDALAAEGETAQASEAFRRAVEINPDDAVALSHLGHAAYASGQGDAVDYLQRAAERAPWQSSTAISLVDVYRGMGRFEEALETANRVTQADPADVIAALDVAELSLELGRFDAAAEALGRLKEREELPDHLVHVLHGLIEVELARGAADRALELAREAAGIAAHSRTGLLLAHLTAEADAADVPREDVDAALAASRIEHRRLHGDDRRLELEDAGG